MLPVMVWFHGGIHSYGTGECASPHYLMDEKVILVTVNYRLGVFGIMILYFVKYDKNAKIL